MEIMEIVFLAFLAFTSLISMFAVLILLRYIVLENRSKANKAQTPEQQPTPVAPVQPIEQPTPMAHVVPVKEEEVKEQPVQETAVSDDVVSFSSDKALTIDDKYAELTQEQKKYYDEIVKYASAVEGSRRFKNARYEEYKVGKNRLVRMLIKRSLVVCEFILPNNDFKNYVNENKLKIKAAPTVLKVIDANTLQIAKDSIDIAVKSVEEEKEYKRQQLRERRKQARLAK